MTDEEYIRKAVELADGWDADRLGNQRVQVYCPHGHGGEHPLTIVGYADQQHVKDALAAQLVRQVDALDRLFVDSDPYGTAKVWAQESGLGMGRIAKANDEDRTMNTIKAIVDSGVLDRTSQGEGQSRG